MPEQPQNRDLVFHPDIFGAPAPFRAVHSAPEPAENDADDDADGNEDQRSEQERSAPQT